MKRLGLILILLLSALTLLAQTEDWLWARKAGGTNSDAGQDVAVDGTGNSYVTGRFYGSATFGSETLISHGSNDIFVTKLDPNGNYLWTRQAGGASVDEGWGITTDTNGNCLVTGQISGTVSFGSITLNGDSPSMFVAKLDGSGNWLWARITNRQGVSPGSARGRDVTTDLLGNCYVTGDCNGYVYFGSTLIYAFTDLFVTKLDPNGNWLWAKKAEGVGSDSGTSISTDASGNSYVTGYFSDSAYFGSISISSGGSHDVFVVKLDTSGNWIWARRAGGTSADAGTGIAVSSNGNSYLTGHFQGTASFGGSSLTSNGNEDIFIAKLDSAGNWLWARKAGGVSVDHGRSIALDNSGNSFVTGYIGGSATFGASSLSGGGLFVTKISSSGDWLWAKQAFGQGGGNGISTNGNGYCIITGSFENSVSFGGVTLLPNGDQDVLTAKFGQPIYEVLTPNGGEHWQAGGDQSVYWRIDHSDPGINILLSINNGASWIMLNSVPIQSALGRYAFTAPFANSAQCLIKVESATNNSYYDVSNAVFSISSSPPATLLLSPPTNAKLQAAKSYAVEWQASGVSFIHLDYSVDAGLSWTRIASSLPASAGSYVWTVPQTPASICYLKVSDAVNPARYDWSDEPFTICSLQLIAPDGGDILQAGAQTAIIWMSEQIASVSLAFSSDSGLQWIPIATGVSALSGSYVWTLPSLASDQYLVRISDADDIEVNDTSDTPFTVASLVVAYPSTPGIKLQVGMTYDISWHSGFLPGTVKLELTTNGTDYTTIGTGLGAASGNYLWTVPDSPSTICKIRVSSELDTQIADLSDNSFTISRLSLLSPNGNEAWSSQTQHPITWNSVNVSDLKLEYSIDAGDTWHLIAASVPAASGSYVWTLPIINSTLCRVRITDAATATVFDVSESNFTIRPQIILTAPNGNEYLTVFSIYSIQWSSTAEVSFVAIEYSVNNGTSWLPIQSSAYPASVGTYDWIVPNNPSETCMVRIRRFDDATVFDVSDAAFTITPVIHPPSVDFSAEPTGGLQFLNVQFTDLSTP
ncbi:MAG: SBBP repeat-containing protein, partial [Candidatus Cloacimonadaceae bacterium]|nr:SBBP repeat-containing protein [Candidatus Cloacimonadaceae bacterium]